MKSLRGSSCRYIWCCRRFQTFHSSQTFLGRLGVVRETQGKLYDEIKTECSKYGDDVKYLADFTAGVKKFDPWIQMSEAKNKAGMKKPVDLEQATTEYNNAKVIPI